MIDNKVQASGIQVLDLSELLSELPEIDVLDLGSFLFQGVLLKEKDFREKAMGYDWHQHRGNIVCVRVPEDSLIQQWAFMIIASNLSGIASDIFIDNGTDPRNQALHRCIQWMDAAPYQDQRVVIKGCGDFKVSDECYLEISRKLTQVVRSLMFGEPCSTVPVWKRPKK